MFCQQLYLNKHFLEFGIRLLTFFEAECDVKVQNKRVYFRTPFTDAMCQCYPKDYANPRCMPLYTARILHTWICYASILYR